MLLERCFGLARSGATVRGEGAEVHGMMYGAAAAFLICFALPALRPLLRV